MVESFLVFGTGFLMRPLGGALLGYIGDKYGRKLSLEHSIFIMALSTFLLGCLPTYDQIGYASTVLLVIVRMLQGLSVGGQLMTSLVFTLERKPKKFWGYYGSVVMSTATAGTLFGGIIAYIVRENLNDDDLHSWGWRIPFLLGCVVVIPGWYLKYKTTDNREHLDDNVPVENPIKELMNPVYARSFISCSMMVTAGAGGFYLAYVWMVIFMETIMEPPVDNAFAINSVSLFIGAMCIYPYCGHLSDSIGRLPMMITGGILIIFLGPISVILVNVGDPFVAFLGQSVLGLSLSIFGAPTNAWIVENFPPQVRLTALSVAYNLTTGIIGGFTPALATVLVDHVGKVSPGFLMSVYSIISLIGLYISPRVEISMKSKAKTSSSSPNDEKVPDNEVV